MQLYQAKWSVEDGWQWPPENPPADRASLIFLFYSNTFRQHSQGNVELTNKFPKCLIVGWSTGGEIYDDQVSDNGACLVALYFEQAKATQVAAQFQTNRQSNKVGKVLAEKLPKVSAGDQKKLQHVFVISEGNTINGSALLDGIKKNIPADISITGGLSSDVNNMLDTSVYLNGNYRKNTVILVGLYGESLSIGHGSLGGWDPFGPTRIVTKAVQNTLYELDGQSALDLYKKYLGDHAKELPSSGLLFPLAIKNPKDNSLIVRTILGINENHQSITFAGDIPQGAHVQLMKANFEHLIDGAHHAAVSSKESFAGKQVQFALLISCIGRKLVLKQRIEEEVEAIKNVLGDQAVLSGFYSNGEISPLKPVSNCELHNQSMTITTINEKSKVRP